MTWATERLEALKRREATPPPVVETLRLGLVDDWGEGWARKRWEPDAGLLNGDGTVFGGYLAALADQMLTFAAMTVLTDAEAMRTTDLQIRFFKLVRSGPLIVEGRVVRRSRSLIHVEVDFRSEDGDLVARASGQQFVTPFPRESR
ncbi:PaaI family thioesterase [Caulobacter mirabilis]|uniref:Thioesterase n=1 Tax=Caulobacter mirabilis TaxID=69666 RepID=A0A2D2B2A6_9CAUL|nr:PaaI family thioesterase [Caulobacter mirabilis]ATQ44374.1 thioesterase [Caulobacter mirabilis]